MNNYLAIISNFEKDSEGFVGYEYNIEIEFSAASDEAAVNKIVKDVLMGRKIRPLDKIGLNGFYRFVDDDLEPLDNLVNKSFIY